MRRLARAGCSLPLHLLVPAVMKSPRLWGFVILLAAFVCFAQEQENNNPLKGLSLEQLGDVKITTVSKVPEEVWKTPAAIYVITQEDIRRSGATDVYKRQACSRPRSCRQNCGEFAQTTYRSHSALIRTLCRHRRYMPRPSRLCRKELQSHRGSKQRWETPRPCDWS